MSEQMWWTRDENGKEHPDDAALFAFVRGNLSEQDRQEVFRHLGECTQCQDYCRVGRLINKMQPVCEANESVADAVMEYINNPVRGSLKRQGKRLRRLPGDIEFGLAFVRYQRPLLIYGLALLLLVILVALALAYKGTGKSSNFKSSSGTNNVTSPSTVSITSQADTPTPTPGHVAGPNTLVTAIHLCGTSPGKYQERVNICGSHFHPGDKLELMVYVAGSPPRPYRTLVVNAQGQFQTFLVITQCRETIQAIYMQDLTNRAMSSNVIKDIQGKCEMSPSR